MSANNVDYKKDCHEKEHQNVANVSYNVCSKGQNYQNESGHKDVEKHCTIKYTAGLADPTSNQSIASSRTKSTEKLSVGCPASSKSSKSKSGTKSLSRTELASKCYDRQTGPKRTCTPGEIWQNGKYCKDECGSGIVPKRYDFKPARKLWCKTPLTLYQSTVGELGRKILCREKIVPRDVKPSPPCNIGEYILPLCRGYYRKYECLRPCEEEHTVIKNGKKQYRDCIQRYWEPCYSDWQKHKLDLSEYAPQNSFLASKLRRKNLDITTDVPCW